MNPAALDLRVRTASTGDADKWKKFVEESTTAEIGHRWEFLDLLKSVFGLASERLVAECGDRWVGILPLVSQKSFLGRFLTSVPYLNYAGVLCTDPQARIALAGAALEAARHMRADRLEIRGRDGTDLPIQVWSGKACFIREVGPNVEALEKTLGAKVRAQVRRPLKEGFTARVAGAGGHCVLYPLLARKWHELGSPILPLAFFQELERMLADDLAYAFVEKDGLATAAGVLLRTGDRVEIPWAASARQYDRFGVNMLLYWTALEHAITWGARVFDFGRSTPGTGNARFKLQWGAAEQPLIWNIELTRRKGRSIERGDERRSLATAAWKRLPRLVVNWLGPYLAARIPY
jgi:FemAB-related protein (PEP-CTERM system-associated)